jgi:hypothetical protein
MSDISRTGIQMSWGLLFRGYVMNLSTFSLKNRKEERCPSLNRILSE